MGGSGKSDAAEILDVAGGLGLVKGSDAIDLVSNADKLDDLDTTVGGKDKPDETNVSNGAERQGLVEGSNPVGPAGALDLFNVLEIRVGVTSGYGNA